MSNLTKFSLLKEILDKTETEHYYDEYEIIELLLKNKIINPNSIMNDMRKTPLLMHIILNFPMYSPEICEYFISNGANVNMTDKYGVTLLMACKYRYCSFFDFDTTDDTERVLRDSKEIAKMLIYNGINIHTKTIFGSDIFQMYNQYFPSDEFNKFISDFYNKYINTIFKHIDLPEDISNTQIRKYLFSKRKHKKRINRKLFRQ
jgi:hypothetical protein